MSCLCVCVSCVSLGDGRRNSSPPLYPPIVTVHTRSSSSSSSSSPLPSLPLFYSPFAAPRAVEAATRNFWANELDVDVLRLSGADTANAVLRPSMSYPNPHVAKESTAAWMDYVSEGDGSMLLVDPPRSGLDDTSLELITSGRFDRVLYVSCNQKTLMRDLRAVARSQPFSASGGGGGLEEKTTTTHVGFPYVLAKAALFDQFPATPHAECAVLLVRSQHTGERL